MNALAGLVEPLTFDESTPALSPAGRYDGSKGNRIATARRRLFGAFARRRKPGPGIVELDDGIGTIYAVGDVHGCLDELLALERMLIEDERRPPGAKLVVMLGDYVDRGPDSAGVLAHLRQPLPLGFARLCLRGNHEAMMLAFLDDPLRNLFWLDVGGEGTMRSYGIDIRKALKAGGEKLRRILHEAVPAEDVAFLRKLPTAAVRGSLVFVHAGIRPGLPLHEQTEHDMLWIREPFVSVGPELPLTIVHGHTPSAAPVRAKGRVGIDTGAYDTGRLTALRVVGSRGSFISTA